MGVVNDLIYRFSGFFNTEKPTYYQTETIGNKEAIYVGMENLDNVYQEIPHLRLTIDTCANMISNGQWLHKRNGEVIENSPIVKLLNKPNFLQSKSEFLQLLSVNEDVFGNAFIFLNKPTSIKKLPYNMWVLPSAKVVVNKTGKLYRQTELSEVIESYQIQELNETYLTSDIIHTRISDLNTVVSDSKIRTLRQQISNIKFAYDSRNVMINNRGALGILSTAQATNKDGTMAMPLNPKEKEQAEKKITTEYGSQRGQKKILITSLPIQWTPMAQKVSDLMLFEEIEDDFNVILNSYGLKKDLFVNGTYDNVRNAEKGVYQNTIIPRANRYANEIGIGLGLPENEELLLDYSHLDIMQEDKLSKSQAFSSLVDSLIKLNTIKPLNEQEIQNYLENGI